MQESQTFTWDIADDSVLLNFNKMRENGRLLDTQINVSLRKLSDHSLKTLKVSNGETIRVHSALLGARFEELLDLLDTRAVAGRIELNWQRYTKE